MFHQLKPLETFLENPSGSPFSVFENPSFMSPLSQMKPFSFPGMNTGSLPVEDNNDEVNVLKREEYERE